MNLVRYLKNLHNLSEEKLMSYVLTKLTVHSKVEQLYEDLVFPLRLLKEEL